MFWKRKKRGDMESFTEPRPHHYEFAHTCMRLFCKQDPMLFCATMAGKNQRRLITDMWKLVCEHCDKEATNTLSADEITVSMERIGDHPVILVHMPQPVGITEAYMVCVVLLSEISADAPPEEVAYRYFTLEFGWAREGEQRTVLCEWNDEGHLNYGKGSVAEPRAFLAAVEKQLSTS